MSGTQWFCFWVLLLTLSQWIAYFKIREWWRSRNPEPQQGKPVDRVLWHMISDTETPWDAGTSWERVGRGYIVALERQGLYELLDEHDVSDHKPAYTLGYCVREEQDRRETERLTRQLQRCEEVLKRQERTIEELTARLVERKPRQAEGEQKTSKDDIQEAWEEWGRSSESMETIMQRKGWQRIEPEKIPAGETVEDSTQSEELTPDYSTLTGEERKGTMAALKAEGKSYTEIAQLFGVSVGCVKSTVSQYRKQNKVVELHFGEGLEGVCGGV